MARWRCSLPDSIAHDGSGRTAQSPRLPRPWRARPARGDPGRAECGAADAGGLPRRPGQQRRLPRDPRYLAEDPEEGGRRPLRHHPDRRDRPPPARQAAGRGRLRDRRAGAWRGRGIRPGADHRHPPAAEDQGLAGDAAHRRRRRHARQPGRRAGHRPRRHAAEGRGDRHRAGADPPRPGRGRADRRDAAGAALDLPRP